MSGMFGQMMNGGGGQSGALEANKVMEDREAMVASEDMEASKTTEVKEDSEVKEEDIVITRTFKSWLEILL
uniref:Uncharacterized protein n=1 Tax=Ditylenchus dipsaci TaxID=166011 RepID=A0A915EQ55_9BILA